MLLSLPDARDDPAVHTSPSTPTALKLRLVAVCGAHCCSTHEPGQPQRVHTHPRNGFADGFCRPQVLAAPSPACCCGCSGLDWQWHTHDLGLQAHTTHNTSSTLQGVCGMRRQLPLPVMPCSLLFRRVLTFSE